MKIILHKLFPYAPYLNEYIGFEDEQKFGETPEQAVARLRTLAEKCHKERYPELYTDEMKGTVIKQVLVSGMSEEDKRQMLILLAELEAAKTSEEVTTIYNEAPHLVKIDETFFNAVLKAKQKLNG